MRSHLRLQQQSHACQDPLGRLLFAPQPEGPDVLGAPRFGFVHRALIGVFGFLSVHGYGFCKDDWHCRCQFLEAGFSNGSGLGVPSRTYRKENARVGRVGPHLVIVAGNKRSGFVTLLLVDDFLTELGRD